VFRPAKLQTQMMECFMSKISTVILVHGAWADGSSWCKVIPLLLAKGLSVTAVQLPLTTLADDAATVRRAVALMQGPVLLVGHSYGGVVITEAGVDPKVAGLVYIAAFAPKAGESGGSLLASVPPSPMASEFQPDAEGFVKLSRVGFLSHFASDLPDAEKVPLYTAQAPTSVKALGGTVSAPAWKAKPSWYLLATEDHAIPPVLQRTMAGAIDARTVEVASGHLAMLSHPHEVVALILRAAGND
jgi:pimeloyl-ACP methyl ester carboxylesterase